MIEPVRGGPDLAREIAETMAPAGGLLVWWLGQSGFLVQWAGPPHQLRG